MIVFDYIFYRLAKHYYKKDGRDGTRAIGLLTLVQLYLFMVVFAPIYWNLISVEGKAFFTKFIGKSGFMALGFILLISNYFIYKDKYWKLAERWRGKETPSQLRWRGIGILLAVLFPFWFFILMLIVQNI
jgi:hypothetical protein